MKQETLHELLCALSSTANRAATVGAVAKRVLGEKLDKAEVERVLAAMGALSCFELNLTDSGRVKGFRTNYAAPGVGGERFHRVGAGYTSFHFDGKTFGEAGGSDITEERRLRTKLRNMAAERGLPYLVYGSSSENIKALVPLLWRQLQDGDGGKPAS